MQLSEMKMALKKPVPADPPATGATESVVKPPVPSSSQPAVEAPLRMQVRKLNFYYGKVHALHNIDLAIATNRVTALIGPSGCGKSTLLRTLNRMHETVRHARAWKGKSCSTARIFWRRTSRGCGGVWAWCSRSRILFPSPFLKTLLTACASMAIHRVSMGP